jgi:hypothetical protein
MKRLLTGISEIAEVREIFCSYVLRSFLGISLRFGPGFWCDLVDLVVGHVEQPGEHVLR